MNKKLPISIAFVVLSFFSLQPTICVGQEFDKFVFGLKVAPNIGWFKPQSVAIDADGVKVGLGYGLGADYYFAKNYAISVDAMISSSGGKLLLDSNTYRNSITGATELKNNIRYAYANNYLEIPISLKLRTNEIGYLTYFGTFGVQPSFLIGSKAKASGVPFPTDEKIFVNKSEYNNRDGGFYKDNINLTRLSLVISLGAEYSLGGKASLFTALKWDNGFSDVMSDKNLTNRTAYVALQLGILF